MADSSSQAAGTSGAPGSSAGHPAESHNQAYAAAFEGRDDPLPAAEGTKLPFNFSRPDPGFNPADNEAVINFFKFQDGARHVLDMAGQQGPTVEEQVERQVRDLTRLRGQEVSEEEREIIETTIRRNAGWLESYKTEVAGTNTVPIAAFNRLAHDYERMQLEMARDRANYEADYTKELKEMEDQVKLLKEGKKLPENLGQGDPNSNEFRLKLYELAGRVAERDREIRKLKEALENKDETDSTGSAADDMRRLEGNIATLQKRNTGLRKEVEQFREDANGWKRELDFQKKENQSLVPHVQELEKALADVDKTNGKKAEEHDREVKQLTTKASELEAQLKAEQEKCQDEKRKLQQELDELCQNGGNNAANHDQQVRELRARVAQLETELDQIQTSDSREQQRIEELEREQSDVRMTEQGAQGTVMNLSKEVKTLHNDNKKVRAENQEMKRLAEVARSGVPEGESPELTKANVVKRTLERRIAELEGQRALPDPETRIMQDNARLGHELADANTRLRGHEAKIATLESQVAKNKEALAKADADLKASEAKVSDLEQGATATQGPSNENRERVATLQGQLDEARLLVEARNERIGVLEEDQATVAARVQELERVIDIVGKELDGANEALNQKGARVQELNGEQLLHAADLVQQRDALQAQLTAATNAQRESQTEIDSLKAGLEAVRNEEGQVDVAAWVQERDALQTQLTAANNAQRESQAEIRRMQAELEAVRQSDSHGQEEIRRLNENLTAINATDTARQTEIQTLKRRLADAVQKAEASKAARPDTGGGSSPSRAAPSSRPFAPGGLFGAPPTANELPQDESALRAEAVWLQTECQRVERQLAEQVHRFNRAGFRDPGEAWFNQTAEGLAHIRQENADLRARVGQLGGQLPARANPQQ